MSGLSIVALVFIFLGGAGAILLAVSQSIDATRTKEDIIDITKNENRELRNQLSDLKRERDSLKSDLEQRDIRIQEQTSMLQNKSDRIIDLQQRGIDENEYRNFKAGIVYDEEWVEDAIREWFGRVKAFGINPPRYSRIIYIKLSERTSSLADYRTAPTRFPSTDDTRVVIIAYRTPISIWRGLTHVLLDKEITSIPDPKDYGNNEVPPGPDELMYQGFILDHYESADKKQKDSYWGQMLDLRYPGYVH